MSDALARAKDVVDLPALFRELGVRLRKGSTHNGQPSYQGRCPFHDDREPSLSLVRYPDGWGWKCHAGCGSGTVVDFIMLRDGISRAEAVRRSLELAGLDDDAKRVATRTRMRIGSEKPARARQETQEETSAETPDPEKLERLLGRLDEARRALAGLEEPPEILARYGLSLDVAHRAQLGLEEDGGLLIPLFDVWGRLQNIKRRQPEGKRPRYHYLSRGLAAWPWHSPNLQTSSPAVFVIEGELNGVAAYQAILHRRERVGVLGMPGAESSLQPVADLLTGKDVYIYADDDTPGERARERWAAEAVRAGATSVRQMPTLPGVKDYAEMLAQLGTERFADYLVENLHDVDPDPVAEQMATLGIQVLDLTAEPSPVRWVVEGMFQRGKVNLLAAYGGVGKSALAAHLAVTVQARYDFLERRTTPVHGVLIIDYEDDPDAFLRWAKRSARGIRYPVDQLELHYVSAQNDPIWKGRPFGEVIDDLVALLERKGGDWLVILDTFESAMQVDSIKAVDVLAAMAALKKLTNAGHTVVALDHLPKLGKGQQKGDLMPIGSVQKTNQARSVILLDDVTPEDYPEDTNLLKVRAVKINAARRWDPFGVERRVTRDTVTYDLAPLPDPTGRPPDKRLSLREAILEELRGGPMTKTQLLGVAEELGASERTLKRALSELVEAGAIVRKRAYVGAPTEYELAPPG